ncbi:MAG: hypothetical protein R3E01_21460 [Pirellulaceae bacterium]|nr:hypothetical protein [Planctomycetales bacterium]
MTLGKIFAHQQYCSDVPVAPYEIVTPRAPCPVASAEYQELLCDAGQCLRDANVVAVYLMHGTFAGTDASGLLAALERLRPDWAEMLGGQQKYWFDRMLGDLGNFTPQVRDDLERLWNRDRKASIRVELFHWSSENTHIARADAAIRLLETLVDANLQPGQRVLLVGHSHAGNVLALLTNLLAGGTSARADFFEATRAYYRSLTRRRWTIVAWERMAKLLMKGGNPLQGVGLDVVTLGTPICYGWNANGCDSLLHFVNHHCLPEIPEFRTVSPFAFDTTFTETYGDFVQQIGITGSNFLPNIFAWRTHDADRRLKQLLHADIPRSSYLSHLKCGMRVAQTGTTLLVDYSHADPEGAKQLLGHGIYTRRNWLPFHSQEITQRCLKSSRS